MYNAFWRHALFVRGQSSSVKTFDRSRNGCQVITLGARGKRFSGAFRAGALSPLACLLLARPFFLVPTTSKCLLRRLPFHLMHALSILKLSSLMPNEKRFMEIVKFIVKSTCICMTVENTVLCVLKVFM